MEVSTVVSIVVPIFNGASTISRCIASLLRQTYATVEIVLINDGSSDDTLSICQEMSKMHNNVVVINQANKGVSAARNAGVGVATGDFVLFVDVDDWLEPDAIEILVGEAIRESADIVRMSYYLVENGVPRRAEDGLMPGTYRGSAASAGLIARVLLGEAQSYSVLLLMRRDLAKAHPFFPEICILEDLAFIAGLLGLDLTISVLPTPLYNYSINELGASRGTSRMQWKILSYARACSYLAKVATEAFGESSAITSQIVTVNMRRMLRYIMFAIASGAIGQRSFSEVVGSADFVAARDSIYDAIARAHLVDRVLLKELTANEWNVAWRLGCLLAPILRLRRGFRRRLPSRGGVRR